MGISGIHSEHAFLVILILIGWGWRPTSDTTITNQLQSGQHRTTGLPISVPNFEGRCKCEFLGNIKLVKQNTQSPNMKHGRVNDYN